MKCDPSAAVKAAIPPSVAPLSGQGIFIGGTGHPEPAMMKVILIEPGAHLSTGHYREKLLLWAAAFRQAGWSVSVSCWEAPSDGFLPDVNFASTPAALRRIARVLPYRLQVLWSMFCTYLFAFWRAARIGSKVFGLTTTTLLPVAAARVASRVGSLDLGQVVMYGNLFDRAPAWRVKLERWSLLTLLRSGAALFPNTKRTCAAFAAQVENPVLRSRIVTVYDPVYVLPANVPVPPKSRDGTLLIPGLDDERRSPLAHLEKARDFPPPRRLRIHAPGQNNERMAAIRSKALKIADEVIISTKYLNQDELFGLFASASWCLIAYRGSLSQGSGFLAQSIVCGTPVLCSRFPHALELFEEFGRLGELFEFDDVESFRSAWLRLRAWGNSDWEQFQRSRSLLTERVDGKHIAGEVFRAARSPSHAAL